MSAPVNFSLLDAAKPFNAQFWGFALPYALYVAGNALQPWLGQAGASSLGGLAAAAALAYFWRRGIYRLRPDLGADGDAAAWTERRLKTWLWAAALGLLATVIWVGVYRVGFNLVHGLGAGAQAGTGYSAGYLLARALGSTLVIPVAEELLFRVYLLEVLRARFNRRGDRSEEAPVTLEAVVNAPPPALDEPPTRGAGAWLAALLFTLGHPLAAWPAALVWFGLTLVLYRVTRSLLAVMAAHALANGFIAYLVAKLGWAWLW